ncbi:CRISPR system precrRNA processing endoribonuclease RAMP protein Cas6 [Aerococcaceae bacterium WS4759]|uniref:CRISPR system precrRNA processing endoribonuclease RAMP protein Cas6 n=1 Tax=Fundicoccus ignavus TaxID=2664442 RepID=A0A6I2GSA7_9LACT|nr:CRISPR system precrRNA processing endoribonuclease RAMP protein Cas6 [Fundicoccus ignavus]MRI86355.1 CRISPR system precrRNA processing endoribonuclease RAMP protein Cas6 [Fundicoccus ignavus]
MSNGKHGLNHASGFLFHGFLNHLLPVEVSQKLHLNNYPLFHQKIHYHIQSIDWEVVFFDDEVAELILKQLKLMDHIVLTNHNLKLQIIELRRNLTIPLEEWLIQMQKLNLTQRHAFLEFVSPTSHKVQGHYLRDFDLEVVCKHIVRKLNLLQTSVYLNDSTVELLMENIKVISNTTQTTSIQLKGQTIPAYIGSVHLKWIGNENSLVVYNLLWFFAELSGVGIKTAMGFGNVKVR